MAAAPALAFAFAFVHQHDLDVGLPGRITQVVMPDHPVEVERRRRTEIGLQRGHLRQLTELARQPPGQVGGDRQGRALGHVDTEEAPNPWLNHEETGRLCCATCRKWRSARHSPFKLSLDGFLKQRASGRHR